MTPANFTESLVEQAGFAWLENLGYGVLFGLEIAPDRCVRATELVLEQAELVCADAA